MIIIPKINIIDDYVPTMLPISITALNDAVSLVHIPISPNEDVDDYSTRIYWTIERACEESQEFFNITSNRLEFAIFASKELVEYEWGAVAECDPDVRLSEGWRVFEINSGDAGDDTSNNYDSPHLRYVSAPLAKAGISILYQSSYHADFLMVKEADFEHTSTIFACQGWTINPTSNPSPRHSLLTPNSSTPSTPSTPRPRPTLSRPPSSTPLTPISAPPTPGHTITSLPSPLAFVGFHKSSSNFQLHIGIIQKYLTWPGKCMGLYTTSSVDSEIGERSFISYTRTQDGASLVTDIKAIRGLFRGLQEGMLCGDEMEDLAVDTDLEVGDESSSDISKDGTDVFSDTDQEESVATMDDEEEATVGGEVINNHPASAGYFVFPPPTHPMASQPRPTQSTSGSGSVKGNRRHRKVQSVPTLSGSFELDSGFESSSSPSERTHKRRATVGRGVSREKVKRDDSALDDEEKGKKGRKICIQLDMSGVGQNMDGSGAYHLDKSGLVTRYSTLLQQANIRMLYSSTFHTANILVEAKDVRMARRLLAQAK